MILPVSLRRWFKRGMPEGGQWYLVGGTVRDLLMNSDAKDLDIVCKDAGGRGLADAARSGKNICMGDLPL